MRCPSGSFASFGFTVGVPGILELRLLLLLEVGEVFPEGSHLVVGFVDE